MEGIKLVVDDDALDYMVTKAIEFKLGGRGLRSICEMILTDAMFHLPSEKMGDTFHLSEAYAREMLESDTDRLEYLKAA